MQIITVDTWDNLREFVTSSQMDQLGARSCPWAGIAIGPESHEAVVRVNGYLLQAGRVLALRAQDYRIERVIGRGSVDGDDDLDSPIQQLQLVLFECAEELATEVARPNGRFVNEPTDADADPIAAAIDNADFAEVLSVPFGGRRHCMFLVTDVALSEQVGYRVTGRRWSAARGEWESVVLAEVLAADAVDMPLAVHVGGTDNEECWDILSLELVAAASAGGVLAQADTIGEIGAR